MKKAKPIKTKKSRLLCAWAILTLMLTGCTTYDGEQLFQTEGCITCHRFKGKGGSMGPDLTAITLIKNDSSIENYLKNPKKYNKKARMPSFNHLSGSKRKAIITFLKD